LRLKLKGNDGGHNGLKSINEVLGTQDYPRLRFGIGNDFSKGRQVEFVLGKWSDQEMEIIKPAVLLSMEAVHSFALEGPGKAMTKFNA
jgi:PTH1 family peptidyl-tRNA hydrolase